MPLNELQWEQIKKKSSSLARIDGLVFCDFDNSSDEHEKENSLPKISKSKSLSIHQLASLNVNQKALKAESSRNSTIDLCKDYSYPSFQNEENNNKSNQTIEWLSSDSSQGSVSDCQNHYFNNESEQSTSFVSSSLDSSFQQFNLELIRPLIETPENKIEIKSKKFDQLSTIDNVNFANLIYIVETYNKLIYRMYKETIFQADANFQQIELNHFVASLLNESNSSFEQNVFYLLKICFHLIKKLNVQDFILFNVDYPAYFDIIEPNNLIKESKVLSIELLCAYLLRFEQSSSNFTDKSSLFSSHLLSTNSLLDKLHKVESVNELSLSMKLELCLNLIQIITGSKKNMESYLHYKSKVDEMVYEVEKMQTRLNTLQNSFFTNPDHRDKIARLRDRLREKEKLLESWQRVEPISFVSSEEYLYYFWKFDSVRQGLVVEKRYNVIVDNSDVFEVEEISEESSRSCKFKESEWFLLDDLSVLEQLNEVISSNSIDSKLINGILCVIEELREAKIEVVANRVVCSSNSLPEISETIVGADVISEVSFSGNNLKKIIKELNRKKFSTVESRLVEKCESDSKGLLLLQKMIELKKRIVRAGFVNVRLNLDVNKAIIFYELNESYMNLEKLEIELRQVFSHHKLNANKVVENLKSYLTLLHDSISRGPRFFENKFLLDSLNKWQQQLAQAHTLNKLSLLLFVLERNLKWQVSTEDSLCNICFKATLNKDFEVKEKCANCMIVFHLDCLFDLNNNNVASSKSSSPKKDVNLYRLHSTICCSECKRLKEDARLAKELEEKEKVEERVNDKGLNAIDISKYSLRLNKARIENLESHVYNVDSDEEGAVHRQRPKRAKAKQRVILSSSDSTESTTKSNEEEEDYKPSEDSDEPKRRRKSSKQKKEKRKRKSIRLNEESDEESDSEYERKKSKREVAPARDRTECSRYSLRER